MLGTHQLIVQLDYLTTEQQRTRERDEAVVVSLFPTLSRGCYMPGSPRGCFAGHIFHGDVSSISLWEAGSEKNGKEQCFPAGPLQNGKPDVGEQRSLFSWKELGRLLTPDCVGLLLISEYQSVQDLELSISVSLNYMRVSSSQDCTVEKQTPWENSPSMIPFIYVCSSWMQTRTTVNWAREYILVASLVAERKRLKEGRVYDASQFEVELVMAGG